MASEAIDYDDLENDEHGPYDSHDCILEHDHEDDHECECGHTW